MPAKNHKQNYILHNYYIFPILFRRKYNVIRKGGLYLLERRKEISVVTAQNPSILSFLIGEIPFLLFMTVLVYFFWIRPKRVERREEQEEKMKKFFPGDRILFEDGMVGEMVKRSTSYITVVSGMKRETYERKTEDIYLNLSQEDRKREAFKKLSFKDKVLSKI